MQDYTVMVHSQHGDPVNTKCLFFLEVGRMPAAFRENIQFHMVSYCSAIKIYFKMHNNHSFYKDILLLLYKYAHIFVIGFEKMHPIIAHNRHSKR